MKKYQKVLLGIIIAAVIIIGGIQVYLSFFLENELKQSAISRFHKTTDGVYQLEIGDLDLEVLGRQLKVSEVKLTTKEPGKGKNIRATVDDLNISGISVIKYLLSQKVSLSEIQIKGPEIYLTSSGSKKESRQNRGPKELSQQLSRAVLQEVDELSISEFSIEGLQMDHNRADIPLNPYLSFNDANIEFNNVNIDSSSLKSDRIIPAEELSFSFQDIRYQTTDELYELTIEKVDFSSDDGRLNMNPIHLRPKLPRFEFAQKVGHEIDRFEIRINEINAENINTQQLNRAEGVAIQHIFISEPDLDVYRDKRPPAPKKNQPPIPQQMLRSLPFPTSIDSLTISQGNIRYSERKPQGEKPGYIEFANLEGSFKEITNIEKLWSDDWTPTLTAQTNVMGEAELNATLTFPMEANQQHITGSLGSMQMDHLNNALEPLAFIRIDDGRIIGMNFEMNLGPQQAKGDLTMRYEDFKISLLNKEVNEETLGKDILSFLANKLKLKSENTGENPRTESIDFERIQSKSTFNYWWKSLLSGLKATIGL